jgi:sec-independent protein translocase protein TatA
MPNVGPVEIAIVAMIALLIWGPKRLPELGRSLGGGMREFKDSITGKSVAELDAAPSDARGVHSDASPTTTP